MRRIGKMPVVEFGDLALLVHLMSAGRLQLFDKRASLRDKASRLLIRLDDGRELRLREFGTRSARGRSCCRRRTWSATRRSRRSGRRPGRRLTAQQFADALRQPRHLHPLLRDQRVIAGIGRSWVDEILWTARLSPFAKGADLDRRRGRAAARRVRRACSAARSSTTSR